MQFISLMVRTVILPSICFPKEILVGIGSNKSREMNGVEIQEISGSKKLGKNCMSQKLSQFKSKIA